MYWYVMKINCEIYALTAIRVSKNGIENDWSMKATNSHYDDVEKKSFHTHTHTCIYNVYNI